MIANYLSYLLCPYLFDSPDLYNNTLQERAVSWSQLEKPAALAKLLGGLPGWFLLNPQQPALRFLQCGHTLYSSPYNVAAAFTKVVVMTVFAVIMAKLEEYRHLIYSFKKSAMLESTIAMRHIQQHLLLLHVEQLPRVPIESTVFYLAIGFLSFCARWKIIIYLLAIVLCAG